MGGDRCSCHADPQHFASSGVLCGWSLRAGIAPAVVTAVTFTLVVLEGLVHMALQSHWAPPQAGPKCLLVRWSGQWRFVYGRRQMVVMVSGSVVFDVILEAAPCPGWPQTGLDGGDRGGVV